MEIQQLKYFVEVVRQQSFTKAAAQLFVTQPMLTRSIKHLEEELNVRLLERTSKSFCLTDAGRILYERVQDFLLQYDDIFRTMTDVRSARVGEVHMSIPGVLLDIYFPTLLTCFHRHFPGIDISVVEEGSKLVASSVGSGRADLGLVMLPVDEPYRFESKTLISNVCSLVVSRHHPFAKMSSVHIRDLKDETILNLQRDGHPSRHLYPYVRRVRLRPSHLLQEPHDPVLSEDGWHAAVYCRPPPAHPSARSVRGAGHRPSGAGDPLGDRHHPPPGGLPFFRRQPAFQPYLRPLRLPGSPGHERRSPSHRHLRIGPNT